MAKAIWEDRILVESDLCIPLAGNQYFPPIPYAGNSLKQAR